MMKTQTNISNMELFTKIVNGIKVFIMLAKSTILDILLSSEYVSVSITERNLSSYRQMRKKRLCSNI